MEKLDGVFRGGIDIPTLSDLFWEHNRRLKPRYRKRFGQFMEDLVNLQSQGVYLYPVPMDDYLTEIVALRRALATDGVRVLTGTDQPTRERRPGWLLRKIPGIGPKISTDLTNQYGEPIDALIAARNGEISGTLGERLIAAGKE
ncbi:MAG: hypothetical protein IIA35_08685 [Proteobacteria bacterium]|nr:hypothetical protein [Pseudomonadota bacterium]